MPDIKFKISLEDKDFSSAVKRMQDQLNQINSGPALLKIQQQISQKTTQLGLGPIFGEPSEQQVKQARQQAKQESDKMFEETRRNMESIKRLQLDLNKELNSGLATEERKLRIKERLVELGQEEKRTTGELAALVGNRGFTPSGAAFKGGSDSSELMGITKSVFGALGISFGISGLASIAKQAYSTFVSAPAQMNLATGSAVQSTIGYQNQNILSGDIASQALLQNKMGKGRNLAENEYDKRPSTMASKFFADTGDAVSSISNYVFGTNLDTGRFKNNFETDRANEIGKNTLEQARSSLAQDNSMVLAQGFFNQNFNRNLGAERALGLGSDQFKKMQMGVNNAGFLTEQGIGLLNQIQSAGGSASGEGGTQLANLGLSMQRGFNITNSGNVLGKLTGLNGPSGIGQTDETSKRILEESIRKGFNKSENTEILRKFVETSANIIYQGEAKTSTDVDRLTKDFSQLLSGNPSTKQFEAASSAYEQYQNAASQTSGRGGSLGFASFLNNKNFSQLSPLQIGNLEGLKPNQITNTNSDVIAAAVQQGIDPEEMVRQIRSAKQQQVLSTAAIPSQDIDKLRGYLGNRDIGSLVGNKQELTKLKKESPDVFQAYLDLQNRESFIGGKNQSDEQKRAGIKSLYSGLGDYGQPLGTTNAEETLKGTAGKKEEEYIAAQAGQEKQMVLNLKALEGSLYPTAKGIIELTQAIVGLGNAAHILTDEERARGIYNSTPLNTVDTKSSVSRTSSNGSKPSGGK